MLNSIKKTYSLKTDKNGVVRLTIPNTVKPGTYTITATYKGQIIKNTMSSMWPGTVNRNVGEIVKKSKFDI